MQSLAAGEVRSLGFDMKEFCQVLALSGFSDESHSVQFLPILFESTVDFFRNK